MEVSALPQRNWRRPLAYPKRRCIAISQQTRMFDSLIEFIEDSLITRINLILKMKKTPQRACV
jgi:hypothetical protein